MRQDDIERDAREMMDLFGDSAAYITRMRTKEAEDEKNPRYPDLAQSWRDIADAIERLRPQLQ